MRRFRKPILSFMLAVIMILQEAQPMLVQAKEMLEETQRNTDFSRPEALTEEEAGITDAVSEEQDKNQQLEEDRQDEEEASKKENVDAEIQEEDISLKESKDESPQEKEVELKEPQDYYPIPE